MTGQARTRKTGRPKGDGRERRKKRAGSERADTPRENGGEPTACDVCGTQVREIHCRLVCSNCGAMRDCSDP